MFNRVDEAMLVHLGFTVLTTPEAFAAMTPETFLFDPHLEWNHTATALEVAHPSFRIGNHLDPSNPS